jgi:MFS family permease
MAVTAGRLGGAYRRVWAAATISATGDGMRLIALPLTAARLTRDPLEVSLVTVATSLPWLLCSLLSGAIVDRADRRRLMWAGNAFQAAVMGVFAVTVAAGWRSIALLVVLALVVGSAQTLVDLAAQAILPAIVPREELGRANGRLQAGVRTTGMLAGPALGGILFTVSPSAPFVIDAISFALAMLIVSGVPRHHGAARSPQAGPQRVTAEIREGMSWLFRHRLLRTLCGVLTIWSLVDTAVLAVLPLYALESLRVPEAEVGSLLAAGAVGGILGSLLAGRVIARAGNAGAICGALLAVSVSYAGLAASSTVAAAAPMLLLMGVASGVWVVVATSLRQTAVPMRLLGRVSSAYRFTGFGGRPLGAALGGLAARLFGLRLPLAAGAAVMLVTTAAFALLAARRPMVAQQTGDLGHERAG